MENISKRTKLIAAGISVALVLAIGGIVFAATSSSDDVKATDDVTTTTGITNETLETSTTTTSTLPETTTTIAAETPKSEAKGKVLTSKVFDGQTYILTIEQLKTCSLPQCNGGASDREIDHFDQILMVTVKETGKTIWKSDRLNAQGNDTSVSSASFGDSPNFVTVTGNLYSMPSEVNNADVWSYNADTQEFKNLSYP